VFVEKYYARLCDRNWHVLREVEANAVKNNCSYNDAGKNIGFKGWAKDKNTIEDYGKRGYAWYNSGAMWYPTVTKLLKLRDNKIITDDSAGSRADGHQVICVRDR
jgi:hypothetical protein